MPRKPNYNFEKHRKEQDRRKKKEEKRLRRLENRRLQRDASAVRAPDANPALPAE